MASKPKSLKIMMTRHTSDGEEIESFELHQPAMTGLYPSAHIPSFGLESYGSRDRVDITISGNCGLYEKLDRMIADCYLPVGPFPPSPLGPPSQLMTATLPAALLAASLLALILLASGLG